MTARLWLSDGLMLPEYSNWQSSDWLRRLPLKCVWWPWGVKLYSNSNENGVSRPHNWRVQLMWLRIIRSTSATHC